MMAGFVLVLGTCIGVNCLTDIQAPRTFPKAEEKKSAHGSFLQASSSRISFKKCWTCGVRIHRSSRSGVVICSYVLLLVDLLE